MNKDLIARLEASKSEMLELSRNIPHRACSPYGHKQPDYRQITDVARRAFEAFSAALSSPAVKPVPYSADTEGTCVVCKGLTYSKYGRDYVCQTHYCVGKYLLQDFDSVSPAPVSDGWGSTKFKIGDRVEKTKGASWRGYVVGFYSTALTPVGYAVESERELGSVQIYPEAALVSLPTKAED